MIEIKNIVKSFNNKRVLKGLSFSFDSGMCNITIGKSGSGKTVLMKCLVGLFEVDSGQILFNDREFTSMTLKQKKHIRKEIGMLFQGGALFDSMNVMDNVLFPLRMYTSMTKKEMHNRVEFCLDRVNLKGSEKLMPSELSGGMVKRVAIARAIALNPKYLFCDEPNSGLDPQTSVVIDQLIAEITKEFNMTTIINSHDMNSVMKIGDKIAYIHEGQLWWSGDKDGIFHSDNEELNEFVFNNELTRRLKKRL